MGKSTAVLVVTPAVGYAELIRQTLEETKAYQVILAKTGQEAIDCAGSAPFQLVLLDAAVVDIPLEKLAYFLRKVNPGLHLVLVPPDNNCNHPLLRQLDADGYLAKPFYLPDLLNTLQQVLYPGGVVTAQDDPVSPAEAPGKALEWLDDVSLAAQHLARLSIESSALAALILSDGRLWAYAGELSQPAAQELAGKLAASWAVAQTSRPAAEGRPGQAGGQAGDMVRFVRLDATRAEYLLFATSLGKGMLLSLAFDSVTPFGKIRTQASQLVRALSNPGKPLPPAPPRPPGYPAGKITSPASQPAAPARPPLYDVPPPDPNRSPAALHPSRPRAWEIPLPPGGHDSQAEDQPAGELYPDQTALTQPGLTPVSIQVKTGEAQPSSALIDPSAQAGQMAALHAAPLDQIISSAPGMYSLQYACLMIPRLPSQQMTGNLASRLQSWIEQICLSYGWRLETLEIAADTLQWVVGLPPNTSPSYFLRMLRQHTSRRIFEEFPLLANDNPSREFWAPGYLILSGSQLPSARLVMDFIEQTRSYQGVRRPR